MPKHLSLADRINALQETFLKQKDMQAPESIAREGETGSPQAFVITYTRDCAHEIDAIHQLIEQLKELQIEAGGDPKEIERCKGVRTIMKRRERTLMDIINSNIKNLEYVAAPSMLADCKAELNTQSVQADGSATMALEQRIKELQEKLAAWNTLKNDQKVWPRIEQTIEFHIEQSQRQKQRQKRKQVVAEEPNSVEAGSSFEYPHSQQSRKLQKFSRE